MREQPKHRLKPCSVLKCYERLDRLEGDAVACHERAQRLRLHAEAILAHQNHASISERSQVAHEQARQVRIERTLVERPRACRHQVAVMRRVTADAREEVGRLEPAQADGDVAHVRARLRDLSVQVHKLVLMQLALDHLGATEHPLVALANLGLVARHHYAHALLVKLRPASAPRHLQDLDARELLVAAQGL